MEFDGGGQEGGTHALMKCQSQLDELAAAFLKHAAESFATQVLAQNAAVDGVESLHSREREREHREMALRRNGSRTLDRYKSTFETVLTERALN